MREQTCIVTFNGSAAIDVHDLERIVFSCLRCRGVGRFNSTAENTARGGRVLVLATRSLHTLFGTSLQSDDRARSIRCVVLDTPILCVVLDTPDIIFQLWSLQPYRLWFIPEFFRHCPSHGFPFVYFLSFQQAEQFRSSSPQYAKTFVPGRRRFHV